ncbi:MAG: bifunctional riboflavin kinase/FAD synthetase [Clostridia bacterium]|nr:bifunctional riboflavin kinase/FAD synthetase [Clostridia bacterium]
MTDGKLNIGTAVALGNFDGLHKGHLSVLEKALEFRKDGYVPTVVLFDVHPKEVLSGSFKRLLTTCETERMLTSMGFEIYKASFNEVKNLTPEDFFEKILVKELNAKALCCGFNYSFGKGGKGDSKLLLSLAKSGSIACCVLPEKEVDSATVSSTAIKNYIANGEPEKAAQMLGRNFAFSGEVIHGDRRGRELGFPTANQRIDESLIVPKYGVYETLVTVDGKKYRGVTNIGIRPTYLSDVVLSETNILGFSGDIYSKNITVELVKYLREERKFSSAETLISQLNDDVRQVSGDD